MSFRRSALVSAAAVLGLSSLAPVSAQPQVPLRPTYGPFGGQSYGGSGVFGGSGPFGTGGGVFGQQVPFGNGLNNGFNNGFNFNNGFGQRLPGFATPGSLTFPQNQPIVFVDPQLAATGVVGRFNYLGHWYGAGSVSGGVGHWYPNGLANGRGVLGQGAGYGSGGPYTLGAGTTSGGFGAAGSLLGTAAIGGATLNQLRH